MLRLGSTGNRVDPSMFFFYRGPIALYLLVYGDDIILTVVIRLSYINLLLVWALSLPPSIYLGKLGYLCGLDITYTSNDLFLVQTKYVHDLLSRAQMVDFSSTPLVASTHLIIDGSPYFDSTHYRSLVGFTIFDYHSSRFILCCQYN